MIGWRVKGLFHLLFFFRSLFAKIFKFWYYRFVPDNLNEEILPDVIIFICISALSLFFSHVLLYEAGRHRVCVSPCFFLFSSMQFSS